MLVSLMVERFVMVSEPWLEVVSGANIELHLLLAVHLLLHHLGLVDHVGLKALALQGALSGLPLGPWAVASLLLGAVAASSGW